MEGVMEVGTAPEVPPSLFTFDLGANGGLLQPRTAAELDRWIDAELSFWSWIPQVVTGGHSRAFDPILTALLHAQQHAKEAVRMEASGQHNQMIEQAAHARNYINAALKDHHMPHSSTATAKQVQATRLVAPAAGLAYLFAMLPRSGGPQFDPREIESWYGFIHGLFDRFGDPDDSGRRRAQNESFDEFLGALQTKAAEQSRTFGTLQMQFERTNSEMASVQSQQSETFDAAIGAHKDSHSSLLHEHEDALDALRATFKEEMTLRGPVDYWTKKAGVHEGKATSLMRWAFGSMLALATALAAGAYCAVTSSADNAHPEVWKLTLLGILAVIGVWAVRLVVRMFLSHQHLATDAAERVTMVLNRPGIRGGPLV